MDLDEQQTATTAPPLPSPARQRGRFTEAEVAGIVARIRYAQLPWWRRWREPRPPTWEQTTRWA